MIITVDFNSEEALYMQLRNRIILGIACSEIKDGDSLPSVRQLAETIGINMHTVNKAYAVLREEGFIRLDRRRGAIIAVSVDKMRALKETENALHVLLAAASCKGITQSEIHDLVDDIYAKYGRTV